MDVHRAYYLLEIVTQKLSLFDVKSAINCQIMMLYLGFVVRITLILDLKYFFSYKYNIYQHKLINKVSNVFNYGQFFPISKTSKKFCVRNLKVSEIFRHLIVLLRYFWKHNSSFLDEIILTSTLSANSARSSIYKWSW